MKFAKWVYRIVGILGILEIAPLFFSETQIGINMPPAINHPEYFYGFAGITLVWQLAFLVISGDPARYRALIPITILEKAAYVLPSLWLLSQGRLPTQILIFPLLDLVYGLFFAVAFFAMRQQEK